MKCHNWDELRHNVLCPPFGTGYFIPVFHHLDMHGHEESGSMSLSPWGQRLAYTLGSCRVRSMTRESIWLHKHVSASNLFSVNFLLEMSIVLPSIDNWLIARALLISLSGERDRTPQSKRGIFTFRAIFRPPISPYFLIYPCFAFISQRVTRIAPISTSWNW
jgi:hypothetical protein